MMIGFGCDHAAIEMKAELMQYMSGKGYECIDYDPIKPGEKMDYPIAARAVAEAVKAGEVDKGVLLCGTGIGMCIAANKVPGIRAAHCSEPYSARLTAMHNDANIITMGARVVGIELAKMILDEFFGACFEGGRHQNRVDLITQIEEDYCRL